MLVGGNGDNEGRGGILTSHHARLAGFRTSFAPVTTRRRPPPWAAGSTAAPGASSDPLAPEPWPRHRANPRTRPGGRSAGRDFRNTVPGPRAAPPRLTVTRRGAGPRAWSAPRPRPGSRPEVAYQQRRRPRPPGPGRHHGHRGHAEEPAKAAHAQRQRDAERYPGGRRGHQDDAGCPATVARTWPRVSPRLQQGEPRPPQADRGQQRRGQRQHHCGRQAQGQDQWLAAHLSRVRDGPAQHPGLPVGAAGVPAGVRAGDPRGQRGATVGHGGAAGYRHGAHCPPAARAAHAGPYQRGSTGQHHHGGPGTPARDGPAEPVNPPNVTTAS
jgi:hypothetical protein